MKSFLTKKFLSKWNHFNRELKLFLYWIDNMNVTAVGQVWKIGLYAILFFVWTLGLNFPSIKQECLTGGNYENSDIINYL